MAASCRIPPSPIPAPCQQQGSTCQCPQGVQLLLHSSPLFLLHRGHIRAPAPESPETQTLQEPRPSPRTARPPGHCASGELQGTRGRRHHAGQGSPQQNQAQVLQCSSQQQPGTGGGCRAREGVGKTGAQRCQASCHTEHATLPQTAGAGSGGRRGGIGHALPARSSCQHRAARSQPCPRSGLLRAGSAKLRFQSRKETRAPWGELWGEPGFCPLSPAPQPSGAGVAAGRSLPTPLTFFSPASSSVTETVKHPGICLSPFLISCILSNFEIHFPPKSWFSYLLFDHNDILSGPRSDGHPVLVSRVEKSIEPREGLQQGEDVKNTKHQARMLSAAILRPAAQ